MCIHLLLERGAEPGPSGGAIRLFPRRRFGVIVFCGATIAKAPGVSRVDATAELDGIARRLRARASHIARLVSRDGVRDVLIGVAVGVAVAAGLARLVEALLFGIASSDPATYVEVVLAVVLVSLLGCLAPVARALRRGAAVALDVE